MHLLERLATRGPDRRFIEVGVGESHVSELMLDLDWSDRAIDLSEASVRSTRTHLARHVASGRFLWMWVTGSRMRTTKSPIT